MIEKIYNEFTQNVLPKIAEGLTITKDYFFDLFGRYIKFLIIWDSALLIISLVTYIFVAVLTIKMFKAFVNCDKDSSYWSDRKLGYFLTLVSLIIFSFLPFAITIDKTRDVIADLFVPEIRVYEEIIKYKNAN